VILLSWYSIVMLTVLAMESHGGITCPCDYEARIVSLPLSAVKYILPTPYFEEEDDDIMASIDN
jgi:hypothetical protein